MRASAATELRSHERIVQSCAGAGCLRSLVHHHAIDIAPLPVLARLDRPHDWMAGGFEVLCRVPILRTVATGNVSAAEAHAQVDPSCAGPHTLGAIVGLGP